MQQTIHAHVTLRGPCWLVRLIIPGVSKPLWRCYLLDDVPCQEQAIARVRKHVDHGSVIIWQPSLLYGPGCILHLAHRQKAIA